MALNQFKYFFQDLQKDMERLPSKFLSKNGLYKDSRFYPSFDFSCLDIPSRLIHELVTEDAKEECKRLYSDQTYTGGVLSYLPISDV